MKRVVCATLLLMLAAALAWPQGTTSRITGIVTDTTGAVVAGAAVTVINEGTNQSFRTTSSGSGAYVVDSLQIGRYSVSVEARGFRKFVSTGNVLEIGTPASVNVMLQVGASTETVEVQGGYELVQTQSSGNFGGVVDNATLTELPVVGVRGRNSLDILRVVPGVQIGDGLRCNTGGCSSVNGQRDRSFNYTLDGIDTNETSAGGSELSPARINPDSISEFKVITGQTTAEYGRSPGAQVTMVTKSGTNHFHGNGFWFYQTPAITANTNANKSATPQIERPQFIQNIYGGSLGGPIWKNKTFFFANVQLLHAKNNSTVTRTVYTDTIKNQGLFRYALGQQNRPAGVAGASVDTNGNPIVPISSYNIVTNDPAHLGLDPVMKAFLALAPSPNNFTVGDGLNTAGFTFTTPQLEQQVDSVIKIDHVFDAKNSVFFRWAGGHQNTIADTANSGQPRFPSAPPSVNTLRRPRNIAVNWRTTPNASITNELVLGMNRFGFEFNNPALENSSQTFPPFVTNLVTDPRLTAAGNSRYLTTYQLVDNFTLAGGAHTWRFGTNLRYARHIDHRGGIGSLNAEPQITFSTSANPVNDTTFAIPTTGANAVNSNDRSRLRSAINDLLGRIGEIQQGYVAANDSTFKPIGSFNLMDHRWPEYDFYAQDTWKLRPNFVVDLGLRLEARLAPDLVSFKNLVPDQPFAFGTTPSSTLKWVEGNYFKSDWNNLGPSIGFAWDPFKSGKTSIRANYRLAYDRINTFSFSSTVFQGLPGLTYQLRDTTLGQGGLRAKDWRVPAPPTTPLALRQLPAVSTNSITVADPNMRTPKVNMYGLSIEREVWKNTVLSATYNGRHGVGLYGAYNANQLDYRNNGFLAAFKAIQAGGTSALMDQITAPDRNAGETSRAYITRMSSTALATNDVAGLANILANRILSSGQTLVQAAGLSPFFFKPYPQVLGGLIVLDTNDSSTYHGFTLQLQQRPKNGLLYAVSWTWSKSEDTRSFDPTFTTAATGSGQSAASTPWDIRNRSLNWAPSDLDRTHVLQGHFVYELPFGHGKRFGSSASGFLDRVIGGWEVASFWTYQTGRPVTIYSGANTFSNNVGTPASCAGKCDPYVGAVMRDPATNNPFYMFSLPYNSAAGTRTLSDGSVLSIPAAGEFSNLGRNYWRLPIYANVNATFAKSFRIVEGQSLQLRLEAQNLTNSSMYDFVTARTFNIQDPTFMRIRPDVDGPAGNSARRIQLSMKYNF